jgi:hypothetical protein
VPNSERRTPAPRQARLPKCARRLSRSILRGLGCQGPSVRLKLGELQTLTTIPAQVCEENTQAADWTKIRDRLRKRKTASFPSNTRRKIPLPIALRFSPGFNQRNFLIARGRREFRSNGPIRVIPQTLKARLQNAAPGARQAVYRCVCHDRCWPK